MTKYAFLLTILSFCTLGLLAQKPAPPEKSDPEARKILDRVRKKYEGFKTIEAAFTLTISIPDQPATSEKGTVGQEGDMFRLDMDQQVIASNGKVTWVYLKQNNEIQITDAEPEDGGGFLTPKDLLSRYQKGDFLYALIDKVARKGVVLTQIEFKPKSKSSEYSKIRININEKAGTIDSIEAFAKDASRYTFNITRLTTDKKFPAGHFQLNAKDFPGAHVEDLRL
ncbi:MAG: outer membrane lipoprotein carrier protein LolA [Bacteroidetes bacterium]|nr:MAG: outer membrane lipoprotein carrier protein LolA [Bacteroidota bacterium]